MGPNPLNDGNNVNSVSLAQSLWHARREGYAIARPEISLTLGEAYQLQQEIVRLSGKRQLGWKVGSTSAAAQTKLGTKEPGAGALIEGFCYQSGATVPISSAHHVCVEGEFAFIVGRDMVFSNPPELDEIADHIDAMIPGLEVVGSRYESGLDGSGRELVTADGGANIAFVGGEPQRNWSIDELPHQSVVQFRNGEQVATGNGADALGHPLNVIRWLIEHCAANDVTLKKGEIITTGTCTGLVAVSAGDVVVTEFSGLGQVAATFTPLQSSGGPVP